MSAVMEEEIKRWTARRKSGGCQIFCVSRRQRFTALAAFG